MSRIKIKLPEFFHFTTEIPVRINDLNYGGHVGNDSFLSIIQEARVRFLKSLGYTEIDIEGVGIIMVDSLINYLRECFYGDVLIIDISVSNFDERGCDFFYRITKKSDKSPVVNAKTGILFYDYQKNIKAATPVAFKTRILEIEKSMNKRDTN